MPRKKTELMAYRRNPASWHLIPAYKLAQVGGYCHPLLDGTPREGQDILWRDRLGQYYLESERYNEGFFPANRDWPEAAYIRRNHKLTTTAAILWCIKQTVGSGQGIQLRWDAIKALGAVGHTGKPKKSKK